MNKQMMRAVGRLIEVQGTGEKAPFTTEQFQQLLALAATGIDQLARSQQEALQG